MPEIELLAPARDFECGAAAIDCGADAVYIGAPRFGAREAAGNPVESIAALAAHAHKFWARVYAALNTLLYDGEVAQARRMAWELYEAGVDGLIIQDAGLLEVDLPPLPLIASTQMHNHQPERVSFLEQVGFSRAILARELTLEEIRVIRRAAPAIELEAFIHGALCVCYSGQCYLSYAVGGRSGNRGQCAQPCRKPYALVDADGRRLAQGHLLSLRDLNLSAQLEDLIDAGVTSFKIEGRLKDRNYVANVVSHYRARLDEIPGVQRSSSGRCRAGFAPDLSKTFNRGYTTYFLLGRSEKIGASDTPKMTGEWVGRVWSVRPDGFVLDGRSPLNAGDGICFFDHNGRLRGTNVNAVVGNGVAPGRMDGIEPGIEIRRNRDHEFLALIEQGRPERRIGAKLALRSVESGLALAVVDEDGNRAEAQAVCAVEPARDNDRALATFRKQLARTGGTEFACTALAVEGAEVPFAPVAVLNSLRRDALESLRRERKANRPQPQPGTARATALYPVRLLTFTGNVLNRQAEAFYRRHGVMEIEPAAESGLDMGGRRVMTTRYCLKHQLDLCPLRGCQARLAEPLSLVDEEGRRFEVRFDCTRCEMEVYFGRAASF